jgi:hypothetical protein
MNIALIIGLRRYVKSAQSLAWSSTPRRVSAESLLPNPAEQGLKDRTLAA